MNAYLINPFERKIMQVEHNGDYKEIYKLIEASTFDIARLPSGDGIYIDDDGLFKEDQQFFLHKGYGQPLAGMGLVLGSDEEGNSTSPSITMAALAHQVEFGMPMNIGGRLVWLPY